MLVADLELHSYRPLAFSGPSVFVFKLVRRSNTRKPLVIGQLLQQQLTRDNPKLLPRLAVCGGVQASFSSSGIK